MVIIRAPIISTISARARVSVTRTLREAKELQHLIVDSTQFQDYHPGNFVVIF